MIGRKKEEKKGSVNKRREKEGKENHLNNTVLSKSRLQWVATLS